MWLSSNSFAEGYYDAAVACPLLLFIWELSRLSLCSPIALETLLEAGRNVRAVLCVPPHLHFPASCPLFKHYCCFPVANGGNTTEAKEKTS